MRYSLKTHRCGKQTCNNYDVNMGSRCNCVGCSNCMLFEFRDASAYDIIDHLLCASFNVHHFIKCANDACDEVDCNIGRFTALLWT